MRIGGAYLRGPWYDKRVGCSSCKTKGGCAEHKGPQREVIAATLAAVYPSGQWGQLDDEAAWGRGLSLAATSRLARSIAATARAPVEIVAGRDGDLCHFIYVLCVGRQPTLIELREHGGVPEADTVTDTVTDIGLPSSTTLSDSFCAQRLWANDRVRDCPSISSNSTV